MQKTKVLIIIDSLSYGGVNQLVFNLLNRVDFDEYEIDIQYFEGDQNTAPELYEQYPCKLIPIARNHGAYLAYIREQKQVIESGNYDVIHSHICFKGLLVLLAENPSMRRRTIIHSHYDDYPELAKFNIAVEMAFRFMKCTKIGCSPGAVKALFGNDDAAFWQKNGINIQKFAFSEDKRRDSRQALKIKADAKAITYVARFDYQKNHEFLVDVFEGIKAVLPTAVLLLVGDGERQGEIKAAVCERGLTDSVKFLGKRSDVDRILNAADLQIFPTRYEGLSMGLLEDQAAGLPCLCSDVVPPEVKCSDYLMLKDLSDGVDDWARAALELLTKDFNRTNGALKLRKAGFDRESYVKNTLGFYRQIANTGMPIISTEGQFSE